MSVSVPRISIEEFDDIARRCGPFVDLYGFVTEHIGYGEARVRLPFDVRHIRPGGTIGGPALMALADYTVYAAVLGMVGPVPLAVTASLSINFLRRPGAVDLLGEGRVLKLGRRLAFAEATLYREDVGEPVAHAMASYSIPPLKGGGRRRESG